MSRTLPRAAGRIPGKVGCCMTLIVDADDTGRFSRRMRRILAQSKENAKRVGGGFWCKSYLRFGTALRGWFFVVRRQLRRAFCLVLVVDIAAERFLACGRPARFAHSARNDGNACIECDRFESDVVRRRVLLRRGAWGRALLRLPSVR